MTVVILETANVYSPSPIQMIVDGVHNPASEKHWKRMRTHIFKFANFCHNFIFNGYVYATPEGEEDRPERIAPLYSEWNLSRVNVPPRNVMVAFYGEDCVKGYILANQGADEVHLDVICAKPGFGKPLMEAFVREFSHKNIRLNALSNVLSYYQQYGFHFGSKCGDPRLHYLDNLATSVTPGSFDAHTLENAYRNRPEVRRLLNSLKSEHLNVNKASCKAHEKTCFASDGFRMVRCRTRKRHS